MTHEWLALRRSGAKRARALRAPLRLEWLEKRNLLTGGLVIVPSPFINGSTLTAAAAIADNDIWAVGNGNLTEHFNGSSWSVVPAPAVNGGSFDSVAAAASNDVWAVGDQTAGNSFAPLIEHWNGANWSVVSGAKVAKGSFLTGVTAVASNDVWAVGNQPSSTSGFNSFIEHWNGRSWNVVASPMFPNGSQLKGVSADSSNDVWAVGSANGAGLVEHWNGQTWSVVPSPVVTSNPNNTGSGSLNAVTALSPTNVWAVGSVPGPPPADIQAAIEHWNGTSWAFVPPANSAGIGDGIAAVSATNIWAIIGAGTEQWNGTSWSQIATPSGVSSLNGVTALSDGTVVAVGVGTNNSAVIVSNNPPSSATATITTPQRKDSSPGFADVPASAVAPGTAASMMRQPANGTAQLTDALLMEARIDAFFQMLDARLISLESTIVARLPQLDGIIQSFNVMLTRVESAIAGHPIDDLSGKVEEPQMALLATS